MTEKSGDTAKPRCPICGQTIDEQNKHFPFCSERCRLVDLGKWFKGSYSVGRPIEEEDLESQD